jgi:uncharacterized protein (TIGR02118 family)
MIKEITLIHRKPGMDIEEFNNHWKDVHGPIFARSVTGLRRYVQNHLVQLPGVENEGDGFVETWFDDLKTEKKYGVFSNSRLAEELMEDSPKFLDLNPGKELMWVVEEHVIFTDGSYENQLAKAQHKNC